MTVDAGRIKLVGRWFVRSVIMTLMKSNTEQGSCAQASHLHTPPSAPACLPTCIGLPPALPVQLSSLSTYLLLRLLLPLPMSARLHGAHGPRPLHSQHSTSFLASSPFSFLASPFFTCPAAHFALISSQLCMQKCNVLLVFYLLNPPSTAPFLLPLPLLVGILLRVSYSSVSSVSLTPLLTQRQLK